MNYIVLDLEWNQSSQKEESASLLFEIIEIGAVKLNEAGDILSTFQKLIKPQVYQQINDIIGKLVHVQIEELKNEKVFPEVAQEFLKWCGEDYIFCTWGSCDLTELQRNMKFYQMPALATKPFAFLDVQKLFSIVYENRKFRRSLEYAVDFLNIPKNVPFHRADADAYYTAKVFLLLKQKDETVLENVSYDVFSPPQTRKEEIKKQFDTYVKYISRKFEDKTQAFQDPEVISSKCYLCRRNLHKTIKWFTTNGRNYYSVAYCEKHGYLKGKIRVKKSYDGKVYIVKTNKFISKEEAEEIKQRQLCTQEFYKMQKKKEEET